MTQGRTRDVDLDGLKRCYSDHAWVLVRKSGTEEIVRVYADAPSQDRAHRLVQEGVALVKDCLKTL
jgi:phosphomannomutase